jgi:hypothetical protein
MTYISENAERVRMDIKCAPPHKMRVPPHEDALAMHRGSIYHKQQRKNKSHDIRIMNKFVLRVHAPPPQEARASSRGVVAHTWRQPPLQQVTTALRAARVTYIQ